MDTGTSSIGRKFFDLKRYFQSLSLRRPLQTMALGLIALLPNGELTTERFPVTYERLQQETGYSRSHTIALVQELEDLGHIRIRKQPYLLPDGRKWNRANVYEIVITDGAEASPPKRSKRAFTSSPAPIASSPAPKLQEDHPAPQDAASVELIDHDISEADEHYAALMAEHEAQEQSTIPTPVPEPIVEAAPELVAPAPGTPDWLIPTPPSLPPEPIGTIETGTRVVEPQSPEGFTLDEQEVAHELKRYADAKLNPMCAGPKSSQAIQAKLAFVGAVYSLGRVALDVQMRCGLGMNEMFYCIDEWIAKCFAPRIGFQQLALRLRKFFLAKGENIERMRARKFAEFTSA